MKFTVLSFLPVASLAFQGPSFRSSSSSSALLMSNTLFQGDPKKDRLLISQPGTQWDGTVKPGEVMPAPTKRIKSTSGDFSDPKTAILINQPATQWEGTVVPGEPKPAPKKRVQSASNDFSDPKTAVLIEQPATQWNTMLPEKNAGKRLPSSATSAEFGDPKTAVLIKQPATQWMETMPEPTEKGQWTNLALEQGGESRA